MSAKFLRNKFLESLSDPARRSFLNSLSDDDAEFLLNDWYRYARDEQIAPEGAWRIWLFLGGRGAGKTRSGAEWIAEGVANEEMCRIGLIGATYDDDRRRIRTVEGQPWRIVRTEQPAHQMA
jgi:phage terminase large subunit-like protein